MAKKEMISNLKLTLQKKKTFFKGENENLKISNKKVKKKEKIKVFTNTRIEKYTYRFCS